MSVGEMSHAETVALVQRIMDADYVSDDEVDGWLDGLDKARPVMSATRSSGRHGRSSRLRK
jgi:hypothetical protein